MEHKELGTNVEGSTSVTDGSTKIPFRTKSYNVEAHSLAKVDATTSRPCAIIGPDRVLPPNSNDMYLKKTLGESWISSDNVYRHPPDYTSKISDYQPTRNISPRQTFQENMKRILVPPTFSSMKSSDESSLQNIKPNMPPEAKYCDVPYSVNSVTNEHKSVRNPDISMPNVNPAYTRNIPPPYGWPSGVNARHLRPYGAPEFQQYTEFPSCAGPRPMSMIRPHRSLHEESAQAFSERLYQDANIRFKPYPTAKEQLQQTRYDYINNYPNTFHPPAPFPPHKYDIQKTIHGHPYSIYPQVPIKYLDRRVHDPFIEGYHRSPNQQINFNTFHSQIVPPPYGSIPGNCVQSKSYSEIPSKHMTINKMQFENNNKVYLNLDSSRTKSYPVPDNYFYNDVNQPLRGEILLPTHPASNVYTAPQHLSYRKDTTALKSYEYNPHYKNFDHSVNLNHPLSKVPSQFSPNNIAISPSDSNTSNDTVHTLGTLQDDCGYVSQSSTASARSLDSINMPIPQDIYRRHNYNNYGIVRNTFHINTSEQNSKHKINSLNKKNLNVRQFLQMWNEGDDEVNESNKEVTAQNHAYKYANQSESAKNQEQLYVLGLVNVPNEELDKYNHIQKISKLPENIKGYDNIEILNQYEELLETPHSKYNKQIASRDYNSFSKTLADRENASKIPRPLSPLDVEAKISQSVIHKEVGCNFEIKPCSPEMLSVEIAAPVQTLLNERMIEKVLNPIVSNAPISSQEVKSVAPSKSSINNSNKNASCKLISSQYMPDNSTDKLKTSNYTIQDLESNSGICLASLPQLDNDIELNFPEINQQFIKANKIDSVTTSTLLDLPKLDIEQSHPNLSQEIESNFEARPVLSQSHSYSTPDKEFSKLSKYRKSKKFEPTDKQDTLKSNEFSALQRIDSVIIKNPENIKLQDTENVTISSNKTQEAEHCSQYDNNVLSPATAIDFSINKSESEIESVRKNSQKSLLKKNFMEKVEDTKPNNISSFLSNAEQLLIDCSSSTSAEDNQLHKSSENQYDNRVDIQANTSTVNMFSEKINVHVITKIVSNLETSIDNIIGQDNINNTEMEMSTSHIATSKELCQDLNNPIISANNNVEDTIKAACIDVSHVENFQLQSNDTEVSGVKNNSKLCHESKDGCVLTDTENICENDNVTQTNFNNSEVLSLENDEKESSDDPHTKETIDMELVTEQNVENDINIENLNKSTDNTVNVIQVNHDIEESDEYKRGTTALAISNNKHKNNITDIFNTKNMLSSLNDPKIEVESEFFSESFKTTNIENPCYKNLQNVTDVHEKDMNICKIRLQEKNDTTFFTSTCDSSIIETHNSLKNALENKKEIHLDLAELEDEVNINKNDEKCISQKCDFNFEISLQNDKSLGNSSIIRTTCVQEENILSDEAFVHQTKTNECVTSELESLSEKKYKNEVCLPLLNNIVSLKENRPILKANSNEINGKMSEFSDKSNKNTAFLKNEICLSSIQALDLEHDPIPELEESKYKLDPDSNNMNINNTPVSLNEDEIYANVDSTVTKSSKVMNENLESYQCYSELIEVREKCILKKHNVNLKKALYSPWMQKLITFTEGPYGSITNVVKLTEENITDHREKNYLYENLKSNEKVKEDHNKITELQNSEIEHNSPNSKFETTAFNHANSLNENNNSIIFTPFMDCSEVTISQQGSDCLKQDDNCDKGDTNDKLDAFDNKTLIKPHRILKRSLSESALEEYKHSDDTKSLQPCKRKRLNQTILKSHVITEDICNIIQTNRRNSISTFYNEENVYIVIDNDLILTDDESSEKLCYTQITNDYSTNIESTIDEVNLNIETVFSDESTKLELSDKIQNEEQPVDESWVEDIACMETVFSEDVAENIVIDTQASPKKFDGLETENDATLAFYDSEHINKIRNIYGSTMCNDDTQLIETLYKTPQMDVNKTLHYIESHNPEEFLENFCNDTYLDCNHQNAELGRNSSFSDIDKKNMSKNSNFPFEKCQEDYNPKYQEKNDVELTICSFEVEHHKECESSNENLISSVKEDIPNYFYSSSPEVSSTTSEEKNSSILLKITNCNGSIVSEVNEISSDKRNKISYKLTEKGEYRNYNTNFSSSRTLITKAAQKYIPPLKDLKVKLHLSQHRLNTLKELKLLKADSKINSSIINFSNKNMKPEIFKKQKPKFEDVLKSIDEINFRRHKHQTKRGKSAIPKVVIKKNENGAHYASNKTANRKEAYNPDLTGRKWQPWVFIEKNSFIDGMALKNKVKAIYCHRKNSYVLADKFRKYKSIYNANFVISQPNSDCSSKGNLKYTIRLKQN